MTKTYDVWWQKGQESDDDMHETIKKLGENNKNA